MPINASMFSSEAYDWATPISLFNSLDNLYGPFDLDPASNVTNHKCERYFTPKENGLAQGWSGRVFLNPPYGKAIPFWMRKCAKERSHCDIICALIPARTDTRWFHSYVLGAANELIFIKGRITFENAPYPAPFPSAIVIYYPVQTELRYCIYKSNPLTGKRPLWYNSRAESVSEHDRGTCHTKNEES